MFNVGSETLDIGHWIWRVGHSLFGSKQSAPRILVRGARQPPVRAPVSDTCEPACPRQIASSVPVAGTT